MEINAAARLKASAKESNIKVLAAQASTKKAESFLTEIGFTGLELTSSKEDSVTFKYEKYDAKKVAKHLGEPKDKTKSDSIRYKFGPKGVVVIWPAKKQVKLLNSAKNVK